MSHNSSCFNVCEYLQWSMNTIIIFSCFFSCGMIYYIQYGSQPPLALPYFLYLPHKHHHTVHFSCNYITHIIFSTNLLHYVSINYCPDMFPPQFLANKNLTCSFRWPRTERPKHVGVIINKNTVQQIDIKYYIPPCCILCTALAYG